MYDNDLCMFDTKSSFTGDIGKRVLGQFNETTKRDVGDDVYIHVLLPTTINNGPIYSALLNTGTPLLHPTSKTCR